MKAQFVYENMNFERGDDPKKAMGIGKETLTVWKCGDCGVPTDEDSYLLRPGSKEFKRTLDIDQKMKGETTEQTQDPPASNTEIVSAANQVCFGPSGQILSCLPNPFN